MAVFRVNKTNNYTVMSNAHLRDMDLSLAAKGLLSLILSLPDNWDYSLAGLCALTKEKETAVNTALKELKTHGYVVVEKLNPSQTESGRFEYVYTIYESPVCAYVDNSVDNPVDNQGVEKQDLEKQGVEILGVESLGLEVLALESLGLNKIKNNKILNNQIKNNQLKKISGSSKRITIDDIPTTEYEFQRATDAISGFMFKYWGRSANEFDTKFGFKFIYSPTWDGEEPTAVFDSDKAALMDEAFKQSAMTQSGCNWRYIETVLDDWYSHGVKDLAGLEMRRNEGKLYGQRKA